MIFSISVSLSTINISIYQTPLGAILVWYKKHGKILKYGGNVESCDTLARREFLSNFDFRILIPWQYEQSIKYEQSINEWPCGLLIQESGINTTFISLFKDNNNFWYLIFISSNNRLKLSESHGWWGGLINGNSDPEGARIEINFETQYGTRIFPYINPSNPDGNEHKAINFEKEAVLISGSHLREPILYSWMMNSLMNKWHIS